MRLALSLPNGRANTTDALTLHVALGTLHLVPVMDRFTWGIVVGAVLLVVAGLASVTLARRPVAAPDLSTPEGVVRAYVTALDTDHPEQAWDLLTASARSGTTRDEFIRRATAEGRPRYSLVAIERTTVEGNTARVELARTFAGSGGLFGSGDSTEHLTVRLERESGAWRISVPPDAYLIDRPFSGAVPPPIATVVPTPVAGTPASAPTPTPGTGATSPTRAP